MSTKTKTIGTFKKIMAHVTQEQAKAFLSRLASETVRPDFQTGPGYYGMLLKSLSSVGVTVEIRRVHDKTLDRVVAQMRVLANADK